MRAPGVKKPAKKIVSMTGNIYSHNKWVDLRFWLRIQTHVCRYNMVWFWLAFLCNFLSYCININVVCTYFCYFNLADIVTFELIPVTVLQSFCIHWHILRHSYCKTLIWSVIVLVVFSTPWTFYLLIIQLIISVNFWHGSCSFRVSNQWNSLYNVYKYR